MNDAAVVGTLSAGSILAAAAAASAGDSPEESPLSPATGGSGSESSSSPSAPSSISSSTSGSSASTCEAASPPAVVTGQPPSVAQVLYMPVGLANIKEELPEPEIQADSELSLEEGHALVQVLEDTPNDEAPPPEPEVEIRAGKADKSFRKLTSDGYPAKGAVVRLQMGKVTYQLTDQMLKSGALAAMHNPLLLTKDQLERMISDKDPELEYRKHHNNNSTWQRYMPMYYKGIKQNYVRCLECGWLVLHKASTGTGSLLRHRCKIKLPSGVEVKLEPKVSSSWNSSQGGKAPAAPKSAAAIGAAKVVQPAAPPSSTAVTTTPPQMVKYGGVLPQNVKDELVRQQACVLYKDIVSADLFDQPSFRTLAQMLVNIGAFYGQQPDGLLASRDALLETVLPAMYHEAKGQLNKVLSDCDLTFSFSLFRHEHERRTYVAINAYTVASDYYFRPLHVKTLDVTGQEAAYVEHLQRIIEDSLARSFSDPLKLVYGGPPDADDCPEPERTLRNQREQYELIPCAVTMLWGIMRRVLDMFQYDSGRYLERFMLGSEDEDETVPAELAVLQRFLEPFREPIRGLASDTGVTISEVVLWRKKLELSFRPEPDDEEDVRLLKETLLDQLRVHFPLHDYHRIAVFLDPKFKGLRFLSDEERNDTLAKVKQHLHADLDGVERVKRGQYGTHGVRKRRSSLAPSELPFYEFMDASLKLECEDVVDDEIQQYVDVKLESAVDIMSYWRNETAFPLLKRLCRRILNIPAACDEMRQLFGQTGQRDLQKRRLALSNSELDMVMYLHQNVSSP